MAVFNELIIFWQNFLYGTNGSEGNSFMETTGYLVFDNWYANEQNTTALGKSFQEFIFQFFQWLPHMLAFLTLGLAVFLFCYMMYKIIKLFTSAF